VKREKCRHGNRQLRLEGCAECGAFFMQSANLVHMLGTTPVVLLRVLQNAFRDEAQYKAALAIAQEQVRLSEESQGQQETPRVK